MNNPLETTLAFYTHLRKEVLNGNPYLDSNEQARLRSHYPVMLNSQRYPSNLVARIYSTRRSPAVSSIMNAKKPIVLDAGCGFGSEGYLFAGLGARVLAVDACESKIMIAKKKKPYYESLFERKLDISFVRADLEEYIPEAKDLSLTWLASVLAAIRDQDGFLTRIYSWTRPNGQIMITDMNLFNPLFLLNEWYRRQAAKWKNLEFAKAANFFGMFVRRDRKGARYFSDKDNHRFDDVQFFSTITLTRLLTCVGFTPKLVSFSGFVPPTLFRLGLGVLEEALPYFPIVRGLGYFYLVAGQK